jgi:membrane-associated protease RseP (regulator of RpoE activity)
MIVTLPYFIPVPVLLGTFGAFIGLKGRAQNRKALFDVAVAGPLAGLIVAVPALWWGLQNSLILKGSAANELFRFISVDVGSSIALAMVSKLALGSALLEGHRVILDPLAFGAWFGIVITALNLLPIGQLDGGYISHAIFGTKRAGEVGCPFRKVEQIRRRVPLFIAAPWLKLGAQYLSVERKPGSCKKLRKR